MTLSLPREEFQTQRPVHVSFLEEWLTTWLRHFTHFEDAFISEEDFFEENVLLWV